MESTFPNYKMSSGTLPNGQFWCGPCEKTFSTFEQLHQHKIDMVGKGDMRHRHCEFCSADFFTEEAKSLHIQQDHPKEQNLICSGCNQGPFSRLGGLVSHIQKDCPVLSARQIESMRKDKMKFTQALTAITNKPLKGDYGSYMPENANRSLPTKAWEIENKPVIEQSQFPALGASSSTASQRTRQNSKQSDWSKGKNLFPNVPTAQPPTQQQLQQATAQNARAAYDLLSKDNPDHPEFNIARYYSEYTTKFECPIGRCGRDFQKGWALIAHLRSEAHSETKYRCPYCLDTFGSLASTTQHAESNGNKCRIRDTPEYDAYMDQLLAGMVDVAPEKNPDGTVRFQMSKTFGGNSRSQEPKVNPKTNGGDPYKGKAIHW
ncbi:hypothetical protein F53441_4274 [Fusarium austroafricanum]|uniref:C2H2-type domain-containing protein n=1 Tax=Fusarium austroafricanum TaxID=2364996 RepID=A0A8H4KPP8_9HYPO|nr:hypothetical protein F53441_4274 [Fusarium austroafricanum]